jgi:hypothetical protein
MPTVSITEMRRSSHRSLENPTDKLPPDVFPALILDGKATSDWYYVRTTTNHYSNAPVTDVTSDAVRCYQLDPAGSANATATVAAGATVGFTAMPNAYHPGPLSFYMAKAPNGTTADEFQGDGEVWFKIWEDHPTITASSITWANTGTLSNVW